MASKPRGLVSYEDFGKNTKDLLSKPYFPGTNKLSVATRTPDDLKFTVEGEQKDKKIKATLKAEFKSDPDGFSLTEKWDTENKVSVEVGLKDHLTPGLKFTFKGEFTETKDAPGIGGEGSAEYSHEMANAKLVAKCDGTVGFNATAGTSGFVAGVDTSFDVNKKELKAVNAKVGYIGNGWTGVASALKNFREFGFQYYHTVTSDITLGGAFELSDGPAPVFTMAADYKPSGATKVSAKADSNGKVDFAYAVALKPGVTFGISTQVDSSKVASGAKTGFSFNFEA
jgi:voltage-dependent anion channel protein 2